MSTLTDAPKGTQILVQSFGTWRQGTLLRHVDREHVEYILADYPGFIYTSKLERLNVETAQTTASICLVQDQQNGKENTR